MRNDLICRQLEIIITQIVACNSKIAQKIIDFCLAMLSAQTVNLVEISRHSDKNNKIEQSSVYRTMQRLLEKNIIDEHVIVKIIVAQCLQFGEKITLIMDRTNWKKGTKENNFLVLSASLNGRVSVPLYWINLGYKGNSNKNHRMELVNKFVEQFGVDVIESLLADREFEGDIWWKSLTKMGIHFIIRVKKGRYCYCEKLENEKEERCQLVSLFARIKKGKVERKIVKIEGEKYVVEGKKTGKKGEEEFVIVLSNDVREKDLLVGYRQRWQIESMFKHLKTQGFNWEELNVRNEKREWNMINFMVLLYDAITLVGMAEENEKVEKGKQRRASLFKVGLNKMIILQKNDEQKLQEIITAICAGYGLKTLQKVLKKPKNDPLFIHPQSSFLLH
jgi:hypothetical protein